MYKWSKSSSYALCKVDGKYSNESTYTFRNNIISTAGVAGQKPLIVAAKGGNLVAQNNLIDNYGGYSVSNAASSTIEDLTLEALGIGQIFPDPENGDFSIVSTSPLATASTEGGRGRRPALAENLRASGNPDHQQSATGGRHNDTLVGKL